MLNNKSINNVPFEASANATSHRPEYETSWKWGDRGKEETYLPPLYLKTFFEKKKSFLHRVKIWEKHNHFVVQSNRFHVFVLLFRFLILFNEWITWNYSKAGVDIGEPSTTGSLNLNEDIAKWISRILRALESSAKIYSAIFKREMEYLCCLFGKTTIRTVKSLTRRCILE